MCRKGEALEMKTVLVTGGIGSGKSAVCAYLASCGVPVYDSDSRTKALYDSDPALLPALEKAFGTPLRDASGKLDRPALSAVIFADADARTTLEKIVYPAVLRDFLSWKEACSQQPWCGYGPEPFVVMESAVAAHKAPFDTVFDKVVAVTAPLETRVRRAVKRDGSTPDRVRQRIRSQQDDTARADAVFDNSGLIASIPSLADQLFLHLWQ